MFVEHHGRVDGGDLRRQVKALLESKGFETHEIEAEGTSIVRAEATKGWKKSVGASPSLEVEIGARENGTELDVRQGRASGAVWAARYLTYSWVAYGVSFVALKKEIEQLVRALVLGGETMPRTELRIIGVFETSRSERSAGSDTRSVDNSQSDTTVTRSIRASKRWTQNCRIDVERTRVAGGGLDLKLANLASLTGNIERTLRTQYSVSSEVEQNFEEEITLTVPPKTALVLIMDWKTIVQEGYVRVQDSAGRTADVPFEVPLEVTFDQKQLGQGGVSGQAPRYATGTGTG